MPYYNRDPKRDHNFDNHPSTIILNIRTDFSPFRAISSPTGRLVWVLEIRVYTQCIGLRAGVLTEFCAGFRFQLALYKLCLFGL